MNLFPCSSAEAQINFVNASFLPCELNLYLLKQTLIFRFETETVSIPPAHSKSVVTYTTPYENEETKDELVMSIKDNPKIERIKLLCKGCSVDVRLTPEKLTFKRMIVDVTESKTVVLENKTPVSLFWKFSDIGNALKYFKISQVGGYMKPSKKEEIIFTLTPKMVGDIEPILLETNVSKHLHREPKDN